MQYQWYPGHMSKAKREMNESLKLIDAVIELVDARIPLSSKNPDIEKMSNGKAKVMLLNKSDMADPAVTKQWEQYYVKKGYFVVRLNSKVNKSNAKIKETVLTACADKIERDRKKGIKNRPIRAMICGIPNVGKSTFINTFVGKAVTQTGNKPGVTKGRQWIRIDNMIELLDTPGILWPKFDDVETGKKLAFIGSINDNILINSEMCYDLMRYINALYPDALEKTYDTKLSGDVFEDLKRIAVKRGCLLKGAEPDIERAAGIVINEFRAVKLGRLSLEKP